MTPVLLAVGAVVPLGYAIWTLVVGPTVRRG